MNTQSNPFQARIYCFEKHIEDLHRRRDGPITAVNILRATAGLPPHGIGPAVSKQIPDLCRNIIRDVEEARTTPP